MRLLGLAQALLQWFDGCEPPATRSRQQNHTSHHHRALADSVFEE